MDFGVTIVCLVMAMTSTCKELFAVKPQHRLMSWQTLAPILFSVLIVAVNQGLAVSVVKSMRWSDTDVQQVGQISTQAMCTKSTTKPALPMSRHHFV